MHQRFASKSDAEPGAEPGTEPATLSALAPEDTWIDGVDMGAFKKEIQALGKTLAANEGAADMAHLHKMVRWSDTATVLGVVLSAVLPAWTLLPAALLAVGVTSRWTMVAHHVCHGGYDKQKSSRYNRFTFGVGSTWRRALDWFDWFLPEAWNVEHNQLHHYKLGEVTDPDLVERNMEPIRTGNESALIKYATVGFIVATWKWWYYAPNTFKQLRVVETRRQNPGALAKEKERLADFETPLVLTTLFTTLFHEQVPRFVSLLGFLTRVMLPFVLYRFVVLPCAVVYASQTVGCVATTYGGVVAHFFLADLLANIHSFIIIGTNHCGDDLYRFKHPCKFGSATFYLRQVVSSVNFDAGTDVVDFFHGFLNYQIEHHLWPNLSMLSYRKAMPKVKEICRRHGVPYVQERVIGRFWKTVAIMAGTASMRVFPEDRENRE
jgi:fatty acid desaturase